MQSKIAPVTVFCVLLFAVCAGSWDLKDTEMTARGLRSLIPGRLGSDVSCLQSHYYLLPGCEYVTVLEGVEADECLGTYFSMLDTVYWYSPCDTAKCLTLDVVEVVFYDVLAPPADQSMNLKVIGADYGFLSLAAVRHNLGTRGGANFGFS